MRRYWDSTSLRALQNCPRKFQYRILQGWVTRVAKVDLEFGLHYHRALEIFDKSLASGNTHEVAQWKAFDYCLVCGFTSEDKHKNRFTLTRSVVWYTEQWKSDMFQTLMVGGIPAVELSFSLELPITMPDGSHYILCGHLDRAVTEASAGDVYICERKTTKKTLGESYYRQFSPDIQVSLYTLASRVVLPVPARGVMIDACQTLIEGTNFGRHLAARTPAQVDEFVEDVCYWIKQAEGFATTGIWPKNESSCFLCEFKDICKRDPSVREMWLKAEYIESPWNPEVAR